MSIKTGLDLELHQLSLLAPQGYFLGLHIRFTSPLMTFQTYDQAWIDHYTENGFVLRDPMIAWGFSTTGSIRWSDEGLLDPFHLFDEAAKFGLCYGVTVACGPIKSRTIGSFARKDREVRDDEIAALSGDRAPIARHDPAAGRTDQGADRSIEMYCGGRPSCGGC